MSKFNSPLVFFALFSETSRMTSGYLGRPEHINLSAAESTSPVSIDCLAAYAPSPGLDELLVSRVLSLEDISARFPKAAFTLLQITRPEVVVMQVPFRTCRISPGGCRARFKREC